MKLGDLRISVLNHQEASKRILKILAQLQKRCKHPYVIARHLVDLHIETEAVCPFCGIKENSRGCGLNKLGNKLAYWVSNDMWNRLFNTQDKIISLEKLQRYGFDKPPKRS